MVLLSGALNGIILGKRLMEKVSAREKKEPSGSFFIRRESFVIDRSGSDVATCEVLWLQSVEYVPG